MLSKKPQINSACNVAGFILGFDHIKDQLSFGFGLFMRFMRKIRISPDVSF